MTKQNEGLTNKLRKYKVNHMNFLTLYTDCSYHRTLLGCSPALCECNDIPLVNDHLPNATKDQMFAIFACLDNQNTQTFGVAITITINDAKYVHLKTLNSVRNDLRCKKRHVKASH